MLTWNKATLFGTVGEQCLQTTANKNISRSARFANDSTGHRPNPDAATMTSNTHGDFANLVPG
jgi:hypothetical protein